MTNNQKLEEILYNHKLWLETRYSSKVKGERANLSGADLSGTDLRGVNLNSANLSGANLSGTDLFGANLYRANLSGANLSEADLDRANLQRTDLCGANLQKAYMCDVNLHEADLQNADLRGANLDFASIPLWCGGLNWKLDKRLMIQLLYHFCTHQCEDEEIKELQNYLSVFANKFHRVGIDCHKLESNKK